MITLKIPLLHLRNDDHGAGGDEKGWYDANIFISDFIVIIILLIINICVLESKLYRLCPAFVRSSKSLKFSQLEFKIKINV